MAGSDDCSKHVSGLLDEVVAAGDSVAETLATEHHRVTLVAAPGTGKAAALRHAQGILRGDGVGVALLEATNDDLAPFRLLDALDADLEASGFPPAPTDDAYRPEWDDRVRSTSIALEDAGDQFVVMLSRADQLEAVAESGGAPGRHATDLLDLLDRSAGRLGLATARSGPNQIVLSSGADRAEWLLNEDVWGPLASAAAQVAALGQSWRCRSALTIRLSVGLAHLGALPPTPPATPYAAAHALAEALASQRLRRRVWAAWQLAAGLIGPLSDAALDVLLDGMPEGTREEPLLQRCVLFQHDGWRIHPILRRVAEGPRGAAAARALPDDHLRDAGRRMVDYYRALALDRARAGAKAESAAARAAALDACAMAQDESLADGLVEDIPDPFDHIGREAVPDSQRSRAAFGRALRIDEDDATAIRGMADIADREALDIAAVEGLFRKALELEPQDANTHYRFVALLLAAGRPQAAVDAFDTAASMCSGILSDEQLVERLLLPVTRAAVAAGQLGLASRAVALAPPDVSDGTRQLNQLVGALVESLEYGEFVAPHRMGTPWWLRPQVLADFDSEHRVLTRWLAARIDDATADRVTLHYADITVPADRDRAPERAWLEMPFSNLRSLSHDEIPGDPRGLILEIGVYGDGVENGSTVVRVVDVEPVAIPDVELDIDRYTDRA